MGWIARPAQEHKANVHWFKAESETGFIFNVHIIGYNPGEPEVVRPPTSIRTAKKARAG